MNPKYGRLFFFSKTLCFNKGEVRIFAVSVRLQWWRLFTSFFYMGPLSFNFIVKLVMSSIYSMRLEKTCFYKKSADYAWMLLLGITWIVVRSAVRFPP